MSELKNKILQYIILIISSTISLSCRIQKAMGITIVEKGQVTNRLSNIFVDQSISDEINDIINYFKQSNDCFQNNTLVSTRLILYGNQNGIGKTAIASSIAGELGFKLVKINAQTVSEENLAQETEEQAELLEKDGPCVIFINNIEFLKNDSLNLILTVLENIEANTKKVILILGTNNTEKVSNSLWYKINRRIELGLPSLETRKKIINFFGKEFQFNSDVSINDVALLTDEYSPSLIKRLINEAALIAARENSSDIKHIHFVKANIRLVFGLNNTSAIPSRNKDLMATCYHEAGHAVAGLFNKNFLQRFQHITCLPAGYTLGHVFFKNNYDNQDETEKTLSARISMIFGGLVAEELFTKTHSNGVSGDLKQATEIAERMVCLCGMSKEIGNYHVAENLRSNDKVMLAIKNILKKAEDNCRKILSEHKYEVEILAKELFKKKIMTRAEVCKLLNISEKL